MTRDWIKPTFLIIGAPRSGTTSVYQWLRHRPDVFVSSIKEPWFFALANHAEPFRGPGDVQGVRELTAYQKLFVGAGGKQAIGEASTLYLSSEDAPARINSLLPDVKLVAILRDPIERAYSQYLQHVRDQREPVSDFALALAFEDQRMAAGWSPFWAYKRLGLYGSQLERYFSVFRREQIRVLQFEELVADPFRVLRELTDFLGLGAPDSQSPLPHENQSGLPRYRGLNSLVMRESRVKTLVHAAVPATLRHPFEERLYRWLFRQADQPGPLPEVVRLGLEDYYREDRERLRLLLARFTPDVNSKSRRAASLDGGTGAAQARTDRTRPA